MVTELNALKQAVAALTTKTDGLQTDVTNIKTDVGTIETTIAGIGGGWSDFRIMDKGIEGYNKSFSYTTQHPAIVATEPYSTGGARTVSFNKTVLSFYTAIDSTNERIINFVPKNTIISGSTESRNEYCYCVVAELI